MGGFSPSPAGPTAAEVWAYATRLLTNLSDVRAARIDNLDAPISGIPTTPELEATALLRYNLLMAALAGIPITPELEADATTRYTTLLAAIGVVDGFVDEEKDKEHETEWITNPVVDNVTSLALTLLTIHSISAADFVYPAGATERRVFLLGMISAQAQANFTHHIGVKVQMEVNDGGWVSLLNLIGNPPLGLSTEASMGNLTLPYDISTLVASGDKLEFVFQVDSDNAGSVNYTTSFIVVLVYRMAA